MKRRRKDFKMMMVKTNCGDVVAESSIDDCIDPD
jgi:hypothetical protein